MSSSIEIVGTTATFTLIAYTCIGIPSQLVKNHRRKSTEGLSLPMVAMSWVAFVLFAIYGAMKPDNYVLAANIPGSIFMGVMLLQFGMYRSAEGDA